MGGNSCCGWWLVGSGWCGVVWQHNEILSAGLCAMTGSSCWSRHWKMTRNLIYHIICLYNWYTVMRNAAEQYRAIHSKFCQLLIEYRQFICVENQLSQSVVRFCCLLPKKKHISHRFRWVESSLRRLQWLWRWKCVDLFDLWCWTSTREFCNSHWSGSRWVGPWGACGTFGEVNFIWIFLGRS